MAASLWNLGKRVVEIGSLTIPCGLTFDENSGDLYVCDFANDRLVVY